jgi:hypothetical protein
MSKDLYNDKIEVSVVALIEIQRAFRALRKDKNSYIHKVFMDDHVFGAMNEIDKVYENYFGEKPSP